MTSQKWCHHQKNFCTCSK